LTDSNTVSIRSIWFYVSLFLLLFFVIPFIPGYRATWEILWSHPLGVALGVHIVISAVALFITAGLLDGPARGGIVAGLGVIGLVLVIPIAALLASYEASRSPSGSGLGILVILFIQLLVLAVALSANNITIYFPKTQFAREVAAVAAVMTLILLVIGAFLCAADLMICLARPRGSPLTGRPGFTVSAFLWMLALGYPCFLMAGSAGRKSDVGFVAYKAQKVAMTSALVFSVWLALYATADISRERDGDAGAAVVFFLFMVRHLGLLLALLLMAGGGLSDLFRRLLEPEPTLQGCRGQNPALAAIPDSEAPAEPPDGSAAAGDSAGYEE
jgi:hypothetical protein